MNLAEFLLARIAEEEYVARSVVDPLPLATDALHTMSQGPDPDHKVAVLASPARVLAECEAKRRIVERAEVWGDHLDGVLRDLALPYADHPDYGPSWRP